jgi:hypothetical protein
VIIARRDATFGSSVCTDHRQPSPQLIASLSSEFATLPPGHGVQGIEHPFEQAPPLGVVGFSVIPSAAGPARHSRDGLTGQAHRDAIDRLGRGPVRS